MPPFVVALVICIYFAFLVAISYLTSRKADSDSFFTGNHQSPWYLVAFGMIGASLSGVTFISVPGEVGNSSLTYLQFVLGNFVGYWFVAFGLLPLYYKLKLVSIYGYLNTRFGKYSFKTGSSFFILSKLIGAAFRLYLVARVLQIAFFNAYGIPFWVTVFLCIGFIWLYTFKGGIRTIVWTDSLQTLFLLLAVGLTIVAVKNDLNWSIQEVSAQVFKHPYSKIFNWQWQSGRYFWKQFIAGIFITIVMTGLDQDMMQKNLTCKNIHDSRKNMLWFSLAFVVSVCFFLCLGVLLYIYAEKNGVSVPFGRDELYPKLALNHLGLGVGIAFLIGITAAAYSSADSALTALTTAFCFDFLDFANKSPADQNRVRKWIHVLFSLLFFIVIILFSRINDESVVVAIFRIAGYTYGPLLGLFAFGLFSKRQVIDKKVPWIALLSPCLSYVIAQNSETWMNGYKFGFELLLLNGFLTFLGLLLFSKSKSGESVNRKKSKNPMQ